MKKRHVKNYFNLGILLFGITLLLWSCERDLEFDNPIQSSGLELDIKTLNYKQIDPNLISFITSKKEFASKTALSSQSEEYQNLIDLDHITRVIDEYGNTNYTFILEVEDNDEATFYNLILHEDP